MVIDYRIYDPSNSFFKGSGNDKASFKTVTCEKSSECELFAQGKCAALSQIFSQKCPHGNIDVETGFTQRARKFRSWINEKKELVKDIKQLSTPNQKIADCGDYVFFDFPNWYLVIDPYNYFSSKKFIKKEEFTIDFLSKIVNGRPEAMLGGEIKTYQSRVVPEILLSLKSNKPEMFYELIRKHPELKERTAKIDHIGKKAILNTVRVGSKFNFKHYGEVVWDGKTFIFEDYESSFVPIKGKAKLIITPKENETITIQSEDQVDENTKFI